MSDLLKHVNMFMHMGDRHQGAGLKLMVNLAENIAKHRDWDAAASLMNQASTTPNKRFGNAIKEAFRLILLARFGDRLGMVIDKKAKHGRKFTMAWAADEFPVTDNHCWPIVRQAVESNLGYANAAFLKELKAAIEDRVMDDDKEVKKYDVKAAAKRTINNLSEKGVGLEAYITALREAAKDAHIKNNPVYRHPVAKAEEKGDENIIDIDAAKAA